MKIKGHKTLPLPFKEEVFKRDAGCFTIKVCAVPNYDEFNEKCPTPPMPHKTYPDGKQELMPNDPKYLKQLQEHLSYQTHWAFMQGLSDNPHIEFETVDPNDPTTWGNVEKELKQVLLPTEMMRIQNAFLEVNGMSVDQIRATRDNFLSGQLPALPDLNVSTNEVEQPSTVPTEPVNASA